MTETIARPLLLLTPAVVAEKRKLLAAKDPALVAFMKEAELDLSPTRWGSSKLIWNLALAWQLTGDTRFADRAIALAMVEVAKGQSGWSRDRGFDARDVLPALCVAYDWCFDRLTDDQASQLAAHIEAWVSWVWTNGYGREVVHGNYFWGFTWGTMAAAVALNRNDIASVAETKLGQIDAYLATSAAGGFLHDGTSYGAGMITNLILACAARNMRYPDLDFGAYEASLMRCCIAATTPDFKGIVPFGDQSDNTKNLWNDNDLLGPRIYQQFGLEAAAETRDWLERVEPLSTRFYWLEWARALFPVDPLSIDPFDEVGPPEFYAAPGAGYVQSRTNLNADAVQLHFRVGSNLADHGDLAANEMMVYRGGDPVVAVARLKSHSGIDRGAEYNNCLLVDGYGQWQGRPGSSALETVENTPTYTYLRGEAGDPYVIPSSSKYLPLLKSWKREILFLKEINAAVIVDRVEKIKPESRVTLTWNFINEPGINASAGSYYSPTGNSACAGRLLGRATMALAAGPTPGTSAPTSWRLEQTVEPGQAVDTFVNVQQYVKNGGWTMEVSEVTDWANCYGPRVGGVQMMFGLTSLFAAGSFDTDAHTFLMVGLEPGKSYFITEKTDYRQEVHEAVVSEAGVLCFSGVMEGKRTVYVSARIAPPPPPVTPPPPPAPKPTLADAMKLVSEVADAFDVEGDKMVDCYRSFTEKLDQVRDMLKAIAG